MRLLTAYRKARFDIEGLDRATASDLGNVLATVHYHFAGRIKLTGVLLDDLDRKDIARTHFSRNGQTFIRLNRRYFGRRSAFLYVMGQFYRDGYFAGGDVVHVLLHETAHTLHDNPATTLVKASAYVHKHPPRAHQLSRRATQGSDEAIAEAFAKVLRTPMPGINSWLAGFLEAINEDISGMGGIMVGATQ